MQSKERLVRFEERFYEMVNWGIKPLATDGETVCNGWVNHSDSFSSLIITKKIDKNT